MATAINNTVADSAVQVGSIHVTIKFSETTPSNPDDFKSFVYELQEAVLKEYDPMLSTKAPARYFENRGCYVVIGDFLFSKQLVVMSYFVPHFCFDPSINQENRAVTSLLATERMWQHCGGKLSYEKQQLFRVQFTASLAQRRRTSAPVEITTGGEFNGLVHMAVVRLCDASLDQVLTSAFRLNTGIKNHLKVHVDTVDTLLPQKVQCLVDGGTKRGSTSSEESAQVLKRISTQLCAVLIMEMVDLVKGMHDLGVARLRLRADNFIVTSSGRLLLCGLSECVVRVSSSTGGHKTLFPCHGPTDKSFEECMSQDWRDLLRLLFVLFMDVPVYSMDQFIPKSPSNASLQWASMLNGLSSRYPRLRNMLHDAAVAAAQDEDDACRLIRSSRLTEWKADPEVQKAAEVWNNLRDASYGAPIGGGVIGMRKSNKRLRNQMGLVFVNDLPAPGNRVRNSMMLLSLASHIKTRHAENLLIMSDAWVQRPDLLLLRKDEDGLPIGTRMPKEVMDAITEFPKMDELPDDPFMDMGDYDDTFVQADGGPVRDMGYPDQKAGDGMAAADDLAALDEHAAQSLQHGDPSAAGGLDLDMESFLDAHASRALAAAVPHDSDDDESMEPMTPPIPRTPSPQPAAAAVADGAHSPDDHDDNDDPLTDPVTPPIPRTPSSPAPPAADGAHSPDDDDHSTDPMTPTVPQTPSLQPTAPAAADSTHSPDDDDPMTPIPQTPSLQPAAPAAYGAHMDPPAPNTPISSPAEPPAAAAAGAPSYDDDHDQPMTQPVRPQEPVRPTSAQANVLPEDVLRELAVALGKNLTWVEVVEARFLMAALLWPTSNLMYSSREVNVKMREFTFSMSANLVSQYSSLLKSPDAVLKDGEKQVVHMNNILAVQSANGLSARIVLAVVGREPAIFNLPIPDSFDESDHRPCVVRNLLINRNEFVLSEFLAKQG